MIALAKAAGYMHMYTYVHINTHTCKYTYILARAVEASAGIRAWCVYTYIIYEYINMHTYKAVEASAVIRACACWRCPEP
jgi:hypothetical protein